MPYGELFPVAPGPLFSEVVPIGQYAELLTSSVGVAPTNTARLRLNAGLLQVSISGGAYATIATSAGAEIIIGSSVISGGTDARVLYDDGGVAGEASGITYNDVTGAVVFTGIAAATTVTTHTITQPVNTGGSPVALLITGGAHTTLATTAEAIDVNYNLARTVQWAQGGISTQRAVVVQAPTWAFATGASTITTGVTLDITSGPIGGTNAVFTTNYAVRINTASVGVATTTLAGLFVATPTASGAGSATNASAVTFGSSVTVATASASTFNYAAISVPAHTLTTSNNALTLGTPAISALSLGIITIGGNAQAVTAAATLYVAGAPTSTSGTITNNYALWVDAGKTRLDGTVLVSAVAASATQVDVTITQPVNTGGSPSALVITGGAHTTLAASTEAIGANLNFSATKQFAAGALTTQREVLVQGPTYNFASSSTLSTAVTLSVTAAPSSAGANAIITSSFGLQAGGTATLGATAAGTIYRAIDVPAHTVTYTGSTQVTSVGPAQLGLAVLTVTDSSAVTIDTAATLYIAGAPLQAGSVTITNTYALWVDAGNARLDGQILLAAGLVSAAAIEFQGAPAGGSGIYWLTAGGFGGVHHTVAGNDAGVIGVTSGGFFMWGAGAASSTTGALGAVSAAIFTRQGDGNTGLWFPAADVFASTAGGLEGWRTTTTLMTVSLNTTITPVAQATTVTALSVTQPINTGGSPSVFTLTGGAHTTLAKNTEAIDVLWDLSRTVQFATVDTSFTLQRAAVIDVQTTYAFVGSSTIANVVGLQITAPPTQGTNAIFTNIIGVILGGDGAGAQATTTISSATAATFAQMKFNADLITVLNSTAMTSTAAVSALYVLAPTIQDASNVTLSSVATVYIEKAPVAGTGLAGTVTLTKAYSLWVDGGLVRLDTTTANSTTATIMSSLGPAAANTTIQEWLTIDINGTTRFIPCW